MQTRHVTVVAILHQEIAGQSGISLVVYWAQTMTRVGAVATKNSDLQRTDLSFFIPHISIAYDFHGKVSHWFLGSLDEYRPIPGVSFLIELPQNENPEDFLNQLSAVDASFVVVVPVVENWLTWFTLKRFQHRFDYVLRPSTRLLPNWVKRYRFLRYSAIVPGEHCELLAMKVHQPDLLVFLDEDEGDSVTQTKCVAAHLSAMLNQQKYTNYFIDPLQPLTQKMPLEVYETFENDKIKYDAYEEAIDLAVADIMQQRTDQLKILVIGPGRGPLLEIAARYRDKAEIIAVERNPNCIPKLLSDNERLWNGMVSIHEGDVRTIANALGPVDLVISELLGSFGCNEACPEILSPFKKLISIPQTLTCYLTPIYCSLISEDMKRPYLLKSDQEFAVGETLPIFHFNFPGENQIEQSHSKAFAFPFPDVANALQGHFKADLYGHISISNTHLDTSSNVCSSWYPMIFPIKPAESRMDIVMTRRSTCQRLWYEWAVDGTVYNNNGDNYHVSLA